MKSFLKYTALYLVFIALILSCDKENSEIITPNSEYYFRCKIDGELNEFVVAGNSCNFTTDYNSGLRTFAAGGAVAGKHSMSVIINNFTGASIEANKIYKTVYTAGTGITSIQSFISYSIGLSGEGYNSTLTPGEFVSPAPESAEIVLTEITDKYVKGTFKGNLLVDETESNDIKYRITEGVFYLPRSADIVVGSPSENNDFISFILDGKDYLIKESSSPLVNVQAEFSNPKQLLFICSDFSPGKSTQFSLSMSDTLDLGNKTYTYNKDNYSVSKCLINFVTKTESGSLETFISTIGTSTDSFAEIKFTKFSNIKDEYIEGEFVINKGIIKGVSDIPLSITNGKFKIKVK